MKSTIVDEDGTVRCPVCGAANSFTSQRTKKVKATFGLTSLVAAPKLRCNGCGTYLKPSPPKLSGAERIKESRESLAATRSNAAATKAVRVAMKAQNAADKESEASIGKGERRCVENGHLVVGGQVRCPFCLSAVRLVTPEDN